VPYDQSFPNPVFRARVVESSLIIFHLLIVLAASRLAAELAERLGLPAVVVEILAGVMIGPSILNLVGHDDVMTFLGELGAILLLLEVGMQMNLVDLMKVGGSAVRVALIGIATPMALGFVLLRMIGVDQMTSLFLAAGITATSVGITARVFGDLRMLASAEARTVLGAAVADDVGGLLILTVVVGIASSGKIALVTVAAVVATGIAFVVIGTAVCSLLAPILFARTAKHSRTEGTLLGLGLVFCLATARLAAAARLAPIVGAFMSGLAISRTQVQEELRRRLVPVGHLFIPIFFLKIGIDTQVGSFLHPKVLGVAALLMAAAVVGKLLAGLGAGKGAGDRLLVGISMIPRGEVGLIFAGLGLAGGILDARYYAVLVAVVLVSTLMPPPLIRRRANTLRKRTAASRSISVEPPGGWIRTEGGEVELNAEPPAELAPLLGLQAASMCANARPGPRLLDWLASAELDHVAWDDMLRSRLYALLRSGNERSWRFIEVTGLARSLLPSVEAAMQQQMRDPFELDPSGVLRWSTLEDLKTLVERRRDPAVAVWDGLERKDLVLLAAMARVAFERAEDPSLAARGLAASIGLPAEEQELVGVLVSERHLLGAAAARRNLQTEDSVLELAVHIGDRERAGALYVLAVAEDALETWQREQLDELHALVVEALGHPDLTGPSATSLIEQRRQQVLEALSYLPSGMVASHLDSAPRRYVLAHTPQVMARHLKMTETLPRRLEVRLEAEPLPPGKARLGGNWVVHVAALDRKGLLASIAGAFSACGVSVLEAFVSTWGSGVAIDTFSVEAPAETDWEFVRQAISDALVSRGGVGSLAPAEGVIKIDNLASPWYTIVEVQAKDRRGLLYRVASALSDAGLEVTTAMVKTLGDDAVDVFYVTGRDGGKLDEREEQQLERAFGEGPRRKWRGPRLSGRPL
jgi:Kef-type K+ transport system membrane component KefB/glycine cleavage system regulatory protein